MAKFLNTSATNYFLEELIKSASERLILISPYLKLNVRMKELLEDKNRLKIDVRLVYGKSELQPKEIAWLQELSYVRTSFCKNLHAKCYLSENSCIITSLNLYEFSQINNNEMGVAIARNQDGDLYREAFEEAQRIIRISDEVRMTLETVSDTGANIDTEAVLASTEHRKLSTSRLGKRLRMTTKDVLARLTALGLLAEVEEGHALTEAGAKVGGELRVSKRFGSYFVWPEELTLE